MAKFKVDLTGSVILCGGVAEPVTEFGGKTVKLDALGREIFTVPVIMMMETGPEVIKVKVPGDPGALPVGGKVVVSDLVAQDWAMNGRAGISFSASAVSVGKAAPADGPTRAAGPAPVPGSGK